MRVTDMMRLVFIGCCWLMAFWKSDWRNGGKYHSTILFMIAGNFMVDLLTYKYTLWDVSSELGGHLVNDFLMAILFFPPAALLFLSHYPFQKRLLVQSLYICFWALLFSGIEGIEYILDNINYFHGWTMWKSLILNLAMFPTLRIHYSKPLLAYVLYFVELGIFIFICHIPVSEMK